MKQLFLRSSGLALATVLAGCATYPAGPSRMALPGTNVSFEQFQADDGSCKAYARSIIGPAPGQAASDSGVNSAAVGTVVGAAAGALLGAASGSAGTGAALGAGAGLLFGSASGTEAYAESGNAQQDRYDGAYVQCMYAKGHQVPVSASVAARLQQQQQMAMPQQQAAPAYPPPGTPPPGAIAPPGQRPAPAYPPPGMAPPPGY